MRFLTLETSPAVLPPGEDALALRMDPSGTVTLYDGARFDEANQTESPLPLHTWMLLEARYDASIGAHGRSELRVSRADDQRDAHHVETVTVDHVASPGNPVDTAGFGVLNHVTVDFSLDAIEVQMG